MNNSIFELVKSHICIFDKDLQNVKLPLSTSKSVNGIFQLDFLSFYADPDKLKLYGVPGVIDGVRDNPNRTPTEYENVYLKSEFHGENVSVDYQLVISGKSPVALINRWFFKVRKGSKYEYRRRISIYGKALKLYYMGYIQRLKKYILTYMGECCRADLCRDFPCKIPDGIIDLPLTGTNHDTKYFGEKGSPFFIRTYDKTEDLRSQKNCFAWFYPERYTKECRRLETQITGRYSRSMNPLERLDIMKVDKSKIQKIESTRRNTYKTLLFSAIDTIERINVSIDEKLEIMKSVKKLVENKIVKISKSF